VDESALTGEVHPVSKVALDPANADLAYNAKDMKSSTIFAGTRILECGAFDMGLVTKTGAFTSRGELLSDVLSFEPHKFKFHNEIKVVLAILFVEMLILVSYVLNTVQADH
jgi:magnesium-transporting ATPase (P-type)